MQVATMSPAECTQLLSRNRLGRLACAKDGQPYVVSVNYAFADNHLYAFSSLGKKIEWMRANPLVAVLVEEPGDGREWKSVVVEGRFEELPDRIGSKRARDHAWSLLSKHADWWEPGALKASTSPLADSLAHVFFRISIDRMSGREARE